jgi:hypothetical protein
MAGKDPVLPLGPDLPLAPVAPFRRDFDNARDPYTARNALGIPPAAIADGDKGDITVSGSGATYTIDNDAVTNAKAANMAQSTIKGRASGAGTGDPTDLSATQVGDIIAPAFTDYTPTVASITGTLTTVSATGRYLQIGKLVVVKINITITTNGTGATAITATLPVSAASGVWSGAGREAGVTANMLSAAIVAAVGLDKVFITNYNGTYPGADGALPQVTISYEAA